MRGQGQEKEEGKKNSWVSWKVFVCFGFRCFGFVWVFFVLVFFFVVACLLFGWFCFPTDLLKCKSVAKTEFTDTTAVTY